jgi:hypothetical protein
MYKMFMNQDIQNIQMLIDILKKNNIPQELRKLVEDVQGSLNNIILYGTNNTKETKTKLVKNIKVKDDDSTITVQIRKCLDTGKLCGVIPDVSPLRNPYDTGFLSID